MAAGVGSTATSPWLCKHSGYTLFLHTEQKAIPEQHFPELFGHKTEGEESHMEGMWLISQFPV